MTMMVMVKSVMLGEQFSTRRIIRRQFTLMFAQALADGTVTAAAWAGCDIGAKVRHGGPASRFPGCYVGLHLGQLGLTLLRKRDVICRRGLLETARKPAWAGRALRAKRRQTTRKRAWAGRDIGAKYLL